MDHPNHPQREAQLYLANAAESARASRHGVPLALVAIGYSLLALAHAATRIAKLMERQSTVTHPENPENRD